ncbi:hypothetical protein V3C99_006899 [Haemonchus contortus]
MLLDINPNSEQFVIGIIYCSLAVIIAPAYVTIIYVMAKDKELRRNPQYRLMNQINCLDAGQVICHFLCGIFIIFPQVAVKLEALVRICSSTSLFFWQALFPVMVVLAISRILIIVEYMGPERTPTVLKIVAAIGWMFTGGVWLFGCITQNSFLNGVAWMYDESKFGTSILSVIDIYLCFPSLGITYIAYLGFVIHLCVSGREVSGSHRKVEIRIFFQGSILCSYMCAIVLISIHEDQWFAISDTTTAALDCIWIFLLYVNLFLLFAFNRTVRLKTAKTFSYGIWKISG